MMKFDRDEIEEGIPNIVAELAEEFVFELDFADNLSGVVYIFDKYCDKLKEQSWDSLSETVFKCGV